MAYAIEPHVPRHFTFSAFHILVSQSQRDRLQHSDWPYWGRRSVIVAPDDDVPTSSLSVLSSSSTLSTSSSASCNSLSSPAFQRPKQPLVYRSSSHPSKSTSTTSRPSKSISAVDDRPGAFMFRSKGKVSSASIGSKHQRYGFPCLGCTYAHFFVHEINRTSQSSLLCGCSGSSVRSPPPPLDNLIHFPPIRGASSDAV